MVVFAFDRAIDACAAREPIMTRRKGKPSRPKRRNPHAAVLSDRLFRQRKVRDRRSYDRQESKKTERDEPR